MGNETDFKRRRTICTRLPINWGEDEYAELTHCRLYEPMAVYCRNSGEKCENCSIYHKFRLVEGQK